MIADCTIWQAVEVFGAVVVAALLTLACMLESVIIVEWRKSKRTGKPMWSGPRTKGIRR